MLNVYARTQVKVAGEKSGYGNPAQRIFSEWIHGKFICKGGRKMVMSRLALLPELWFWSDGVALRASSTATPSLQNHTFGGKPAHDENRYRVKLRPNA